MAIVLYTSLVYIVRQHDSLNFNCKIKQTWETMETPCISFTLNNLLLFFRNIKTIPQWIKNDKIMYLFFTKNNYSILFDSNFNFSTTLICLDIDFQQMESGDRQNYTYV